MDIPPKIPVPLPTQSHATPLPMHLMRQVAGMQRMLLQIYCSFFGCIVNFFAWVLLGWETLYGQPSCKRRLVGLFKVNGSFQAHANMPLQQPLIAPRQAVRWHQSACREDLCFKSTTSFSCFYSSTSANML